MHLSCLLQAELLRDNFNPVSVKVISVSSLPLTQADERCVPIAVQNEGNVLHLSVGQLLLELDAHLLESLARLLDVFNRATTAKNASAQTEHA
jgi:chaperone required for assembly of F1-ATPase